MYTSIRILVHQPVTNRLCEDFFIERLLKEGIDFAFYDLTSIFHENLNIRGEIIEPYVFKLSSIKEFENRIKNDVNINVLYIPYFIYEYKVINVYRLLTKYDCKIAFMGRGALLLPNMAKSYLEIAVRKFSSLFNLGFLLRGFSRIYANYLKKIGYIKKFDVIFNAGNNGHYTCGTSFEINDALKVPFNSTDYSRYLSSLSKEHSLTNARYAVFIDEYLPYHPDIEMCGLKSVNALSYYRNLNAFFDLMESKLDMPIVIAAHPKSDYLNNPYNGRQLIKGSTEILIKNSEFVIDHFSTAISYAVLNFKPLLLIYSNELNRVYPDLVKYAENLATELNVDIINTDNEDINFNLNVDADRYNKYKYDFLTMIEAEFKLDQDIFVDFLRCNPLMS